MTILDYIVDNFYKMAASVLTISFGGYVTWRIYRKKRFTAASDKFRSTILNEFRGLYPYPTEWPDNDIYIDKILKDKFPSIQAAVKDFRSHLPWFSKTRFDAAWLKYYNHSYGQFEEECYLDYIHSGDNPNYKENFKKNVDNLMRFAK